MKKIAIIEYGALTTTAGGVESYIINQVRHIDRNKLQIDFCVPLEDEKLAYEDELRSLDSKIYRCYRRWKNSFIGHYIDLFHFFYEKHNEYDIAVAQYLDFQNINFLIVAKIFGLKTVAHSHNSDVDRGWKYRVLIFTNRIIGMFVIDRVFACAKHAGEWMFGNMLWNLKHGEVIHNGIDLNKFSYNSDARMRIRRQIKAADSTVIIGHSGRLTRSKNHKFLLQVFSEFHKVYPDSILLLIGVGELYDFLNQQAEDLNIKKAVRFLGYQSNVNEWLQAMDFFVFPSLFEGLPFSLVEAQAAGLICLVSNKVTEEIKITSRCQFIGLDKSPSDWAKYVKNWIGYERFNMTEILRINGYDIADQSSMFLDTYMNILKHK